MAKTYAEDGVDIDASEEATASLIAKIKGTNRKGNGEPIELVNGFAGLVKLDDKALAVCTDGVGTKILLAEELDSLHTVGIDCVAMNVNDLLAGGAKPLFFLDYIGIDKMSNDKCNKIIKGINKGCELAKCKLIGGETAEMKGIYLKDKLDIAGFSVCLLYTSPRPRDRQKCRITGEG